MATRTLGRPDRRLMPQGVPEATMAFWTGSSAAITPRWPMATPCPISRRRATVRGDPIVRPFGAIEGRDHDRYPAGGVRSPAFRPAHIPQPFFGTLQLFRSCFRNEEHAVAVPGHVDGRPRSRLRRYIYARNLYICYNRLTDQPSVLICFSAHQAHTQGHRSMRSSIPSPRNLPSLCNHPAGLLVRKSLE
jgi:hypothetical protein